MKVFNFFAWRLFSRRWLLSLLMLVLLLASNYLTFTIARSLISTNEGYRQIQSFNQKGFYIANLAPNSTPNMDKIRLKKTRQVYGYLRQHFKYALTTEGFTVNVAHMKMDASLSYLNENAYRLRNFKLAQGKKIDFDQRFKSKQIPVLIGAGLAKKYPLASVIKITDPVLNKPVSFKVVGILKKDTSQANFYALNSKNYTNFTIVVPIQNTFLNQASKAFLLNGLMDLTLMNAKKGQLKNFQQIIAQKLHFNLNFYSQKQNNAFFNKYYLSNIKLILLVTLVLLLSALFFILWNSYISVNLMLKALTLNLLLGLSYRKLKRIFYGYFWMLESFTLMMVAAVVWHTHFNAWQQLDPLFAIYGTLGFLPMEWKALGWVLIVALVSSVFTVETMMHFVKKMPISLGVLQ